MEIFIIHLGESIKFLVEEISPHNAYLLIINSHNLDLLLIHKILTIKIIQSNLIHSKIFSKIISIIFLPKGNFEDPIASFMQETSSTFSLCALHFIDIKAWFAHITNTVDV